MAEKKEEEEEEEDGANWSDLPYDLMEQILNKTTVETPDISNYARCAAVCVSWRHAYNIHEPDIPPQLPILMISSTTTVINSPLSNEADDGFCSFYKIMDRKVYDQFEVRMPRNCHCRGSSHGWLIMVEDDLDKGFPVRLFNPFLSSDNEILLPSLMHFPVAEEDPDGNPDPYPCDYTYLHKAILSADPLSHPDYIVIAIYGYEFKSLAVLRSGDEVWTPIGSDDLNFEDVIYEFKPTDNSRRYWMLMLYAVTSRGNLVNFRVPDLLAHQNSSTTEEIIIKNNQMGGAINVRGPPFIHTEKLYLVSTKKTLLLVLRAIDMADDIDHDEAETTNISIPYSTKEFKVFGLVPLRLTAGKPCTFEWKEMDNLRGCTLFVGDNTSMCINVADYPPGCKPDCIYYTDDYYLGYGPHDMGVFNVKDKSFEKHFPNDRSNSICPDPVWIEPSLQKKGNIYKYIT